MSLRSKLSGALAEKAQKLYQEAVDAAGGNVSAARSAKLMEQAEDEALNLKSMADRGAASIERAQGTPRREFPDSTPVSRSEAVVDNNPTQVDPIAGSRAVAPSLRDRNIGLGALGLSGMAATTSGTLANMSKQQAPAPGSFPDRPTGATGEWDSEETEAKPARSRNVESTMGVGPVANADLYGSAIKQTPQAEPTAPVPVDVSATELRSAVKAYENSLKALPKEADTSEINDEIRTLRQEFRDAKTQNEKNELYQLIASSIAKFGAYKWGSERGQVIGDKLDIPTIDYGKRTEQSMKELSLGLDEAGSRRRSLEETVRENNRLAESARQRAGEARIGAESTVYKQKSDNARDDLRFSRDLELQKQKPAEDKQGQLIRSEGAKQVEDARKKLDQLEPVDKAVNALVKKGDLSQARQLASSQGMTDDEISSVEDPGGMSDWTSSEEKKANILAAIKRQIESIKRPAEQELQQAVKLRQHGVDLPSQAGAAAPSASKAESPRVDANQLREYMKQYNMDEKAARAYLESTGYKVD